MMSPSTNDQAAGAKQRLRIIGGPRDQEWLEVNASMRCGQPIYLSDPPARTVGFYNEVGLLVGQSVTCYTVRALGGPDTNDLTALYYLAPVYWRDECAIAHLLAWPAAKDAAAALLEIEALRMEIFARRGQVECLINGVRKLAGLDPVPLDLERP